MNDHLDPERALILRVACVLNRPGQRAPVTTLDLTATPYAFAPREEDQ